MTLKTRAFYSLLQLKHWLTVQALQFRGTC